MPGSIDSSYSQDPPRTGEGWSDAELHASVVAYKQLMLGERGNKAATYRELGQRFGRKPEAYERRMQNISSVLDDLRMAWLPGLKPQSNIGQDLRPRLLRFVLSEFGENQYEGHPAAIEPEVVARIKRGHLKIPAGQRQPKVMTKQVVDFVRDPGIKAWVLANAQGRCECCRQIAPFRTRDDLPFLEVHHVTTLAEGGSDTIENTVALCPNCHRRMHYGVDATETKDRLYASIARLKREPGAQALPGQ